MPDRATVVAFIGFVLLGGVNFVAVRFSNRELEPLFGAGIRFFAAAVLLAAAFLVRKNSLPRGRALLGVVLYGVFSFGFAYAFAYIALSELPAGIGSVIFASLPLFVAILAHLHRIEHLRWQALVGALITLVGISILSNPFAASSVPLAAVLTMLVSAVAAAEGTVIVKLFPPVPPLVANSVAMLVGGALLLAASAVLGERWQVPQATPTRWAVLYLVVASAVMFALYVFVVRRWGAGPASYTAPLLPLTAVIAAAPLLGERLSPAGIIGGLVVLAGVYLGALAPSRSVAPPPVAG